MKDCLIIIVSCLKRRNKKRLISSTILKEYKILAFFNFLILEILKLLPYMALQLSESLFVCLQFDRLQYTEQQNTTITLAPIDHYPFRGRWSSWLWWTSYPPAPAAENRLVKTVKSKIILLGWNFFIFASRVDVIYIKIFCDFIRNINFIKCISVLIPPKLSSIFNKISFIFPKPTITVYTFISKFWIYYLIYLNTLLELI